MSHPPADVVDVVVSRKPVIRADPTTGDAWSISTHVAGEPVLTDFSLKICAVKPDDGFVTRVKYFVVLY